MEINISFRAVKITAFITTTQLQNDNVGSQVVPPAMVEARANASKKGTGQGNKHSRAKSNGGGDTVLLFSTNF